MTKIAVTFLLAAAIAAGTPSSLALAQPGSPAVSKPFGDLFRPAAPGPGVRLQLPPHVFVKRAVPPPTSKPDVVCGMTLVPGDPKMDKGIQHDTPKNPHFSIRAVEPEVCRR
jgi:hypothetical protein